MAEIQEFLSKKAEEQINRYEKTINNLVVVYNKLSGEAQKLDAKQKEQVNTQKELDNQTKAYNSLLSQLNATSGKLQVAESGLNKELIRQRQALQQVNKDIKASSSLYATLNNRLEKSRQKARELGVQYGTNSKKFKAAKRDVLKLDNQIKKIDASLGQHYRNVGNYTSALVGMGKEIRGAFGVVGGMMLFASAIKDVIRIGKEYEKQNAVLASVLGKTLKETTKLQKQSKELGASTAFSATQVTELQTELARLGKTEDEIIGSTEGIIDATLALGSETGETAALVGATLNAFNLSAEESKRVADVLTLSTQKSALSFEKLNTAIPITAGAAAAANVPFEMMIAQLGKAADRGIDASTAATSLRNIYIELANKGITLEQALREINTSQDRLSKATELFGKRAAVTALALADNVDQTNELNTALENAGGTAKKVAETQLDTLDGQLKLLNSAWEGLILNINNSETAIGSFSKSFIGFLTKALNQFANLGKEWELFKKSLIGGWEEADESLLNYIANSSRVEDSNGVIKNTKDVLDQVADSYRNLTFEQQQYVDVNEQMALALLKAGANAEIVDGVVSQYLKTLDLEKKALSDINYEYDDSSDLLEDQKNNKEELNKITKETIRLADEERKRLDRQIEAPDPIKMRGEELKNTSEIQEGFTEEAEQKSLRLFDYENNLRIKKGQQDLESYEAKKALTQLEKENSINAAYDAASFASSILGEQTVAGKTASAIQATISGYLGAQKAFTDTPGPLPVKILAGAAAAGIALKNVQNIISVNPTVPEIQAPAFAEGTESTPSGTWLAGEEGRELKVDKYGNMQLINTPTLFNNESGSKIFSNPDTERILRGDMPSKRSLDTEKIVGAIRENRSQMNVMLDKYGIINISRNGRNRTKILNSKFRNKA